MQSRIILNLVLLLAVVALAVAAWFVYKDKTAVSYLSSLQVSQVTSIVIPREHGDIVLSKAGKTWRMEKPYAMAAHDFRIQSLSGLLQTPVSQSYAATELDLAEFGLMPARATIRYNNHEIKFGKSNPVNNKRYLLSEGRIYLLNDTLYPLVSAEAASLVSLSLLEPDASIEKISLPDLTLQKDMDNLWHDQHGNTIAADSAQQLLDNWRDASAYGVHAYLARPNAKAVTIELGNITALHFLVAEENNALIIGRPDAGIEYHFDAQYAEEIMKLPQK